MAEILIVASKVKKYVKDKSQMNTSAAVFDILTKVIQTECDKAIEKAKSEGRKTVMDRDFTG